MKRVISLKIQMLLLFLAALVSFGFILSLASAFGVNFLKERLVENAVKLAEQQSRDIAEQIMETLEQEQVKSLSDLEDVSRIRVRIERVFSQNRSLMVAWVLDENGKVIFENYRTTWEIGERLSPESGMSLNPEELTPEQIKDIIAKEHPEMSSVIQPLMRKEELAGEVRLRISKNAVFAEIGSISKNITTRLSFMIGALFIIVIAVFFLLWRTFQRHLSLVEETDRLDRMAYVGTLASGLAHEIRNPLNAMKVNLDVIKETLNETDTEEKESLTQTIENVRTQVDQLNRTLTNYLIFAVPKQLATQQIDLASVVKETAAFLQPEFEKEGITLDLTHVSCFERQGDAAALRQVFMNLFLNAAQVMKDSMGKKRIVVDFEIDKALCTVRITDTGPGVPEEELEKMFEVFYSTKPAGSGFGLAIARTIVEQHKGSIHAECVPSGGLSIIIRLPKQF